MGKKPDGAVIDKPSRSKPKMPVVVIGEKPPPIRARAVRVAISGHDANGTKQRVVFEAWGSDWTTVSDMIVAKLKEIAERK